MRFTALRRVNTVADSSVTSDSSSAGVAETSSEKTLHLSDSCVEVSLWCATWSTMQYSPMSYDLIL